MKTYLTKSLQLLSYTMILCCGVYPLTVWIIGQSIFSFQANGSVLLNQAGQPVASRLIAQKFTLPEYFHPRPSAADFNAELSASSALAVTNPALRQRLEHALVQLAAEGVDASVAPVPADAVMTSASGLDPAISLAYAERQLDRIAGAWAQKLGQPSEKIRQTIETILQENVFAPLGLSDGTAAVNVMTLNWILSATYAENRHE